MNAETRGANVLHVDVLDAIRGVYATAYGNGYGLSLEEQLEARRLAADALATAILERYGVRLYKPGEKPGPTCDLCGDPCQPFENNLHASCARREQYLADR
jgi:hypothetical protein